MVQIIKSGTIKVPTQPKDFDLKATGLVFKSYDNQVALEFNVEKQDGTPADLLGANLRLLMFIYDEIDGTVTKEPIPFITKNLITESFLNGHVVYILPEAMKAYNGMVEAYVYIEYPDGSTSDNLGFTFRMKRSAIDGLAQDKADYFIADFQQLLDRVKQEVDQKIAESETQIDAKVKDTNDKITKANQDVATLDQNLTELRNDMKLSEAWAWSKDGTDRFTRKYPGENYAKNSRRTLELSNVTNNINLLKGDVPYNFADLAEKTVTISVEIEVKNAQPQTSGVDFRIGCEATIPRASGGTFYLGVWENLSAGQTIATKRISRTLSIPNDIVATQAAGLHLYVQANGDYFRVSKPKIEIGDTPTIYTPAPSEDYANAYPQYRGLALLPSDLPDDYSWDITPEYTEKGLNDTVSLTEPQSVLGLKNFSDGIQIAGDKVISENDCTVYTLTKDNSQSFIDGYATFIKHGKIVIVNGTVKFKKAYAFGVPLDDEVPEEFIARGVNGMIIGASGTSNSAKMIYVRQDFKSIMTNSEFAINEWFTFNGVYWVGEE